VARIDGVDLYIHWSTFVVAALAVLAALPRPEGALLLIGGYLAIVMIHEWGHVIAARRRRCVAWSIEIYPVVGLTRYSAPTSFFDECAIAWGGVLAQLAVAAPLLAWVAVFGTENPATNVVVGIFGYLSLLLAMLNLLPAPRLDGAKAWQLIPMLFGRGIGFYLRRRRPAIGPSRKKTWIH
jgi:Zn-dependent protease